MNLFRTYLKLRIKSGFRLLKGIGMVRSSILLLIVISALTILTKIENRWALPTLCILLLGGYHYNRKDKPFLLVQTKKYITFLRKEYLLAGFPFLIIAILKNRWLEAAGLFVFCWFLPYLKDVKLKSNESVRIPFLFRGGMEYIRMFRRYWWVYALLLLCSVMGGVHENIRLTKVCFIIWCLLQATAFSVLPDRLQVLNFSSYKRFHRMLWQMCAWNVFVTGLPFIAFILIFDPTVENMLFSVSTIISSIIYLTVLGLIRHVCDSETGLSLLHIVVLLPLFFFSCLIPYLLLGFILIERLTSYITKKQLEHIWN